MLYLYISKEGLIFCLRAAVRRVDTDEVMFRTFIFSTYSLQHHDRACGLPADCGLRARAGTTTVQELRSRQSTHSRPRHRLNMLMSHLSLEDLNIMSHLSLEAGWKVVVVHEAATSAERRH